jgi:hypothetical protein
MRIFLFPLFGMAAVAAALAFHLTGPGPANANASRAAASSRAGVSPSERPLAPPRFVLAPAAAGEADDARPAGASDSQRSALESTLDPYQAREAAERRRREGEAAALRKAEQVAQQRGLGPDEKLRLEDELVNASNAREDQRDRVARGETIPAPSH